MKYPQDCQQANREAKTRKPIATVIIIHLLLNDNCHFTSLFTGKKDMLHQEKSTSITVSCHISYCERDKYPSSFTGCHFPFLYFFLKQQELVRVGGGSGVEDLTTFGPYHATIRSLQPWV